MQKLAALVAGPPWPAKPTAPLPATVLNTPWPRHSVTKANPTKVRHVIVMKPLRPARYCRTVRIVPAGDTTPPMLARMGQSASSRVVGSWTVSAGKDAAGMVGPNRVARRIMTSPSLAATVVTPLSVLLKGPSLVFSGERKNTHDTENPGMFYACGPLQSLNGEMGLGGEYSQKL